VRRPRGEWADVGRRGEWTDRRARDDRLECRPRDEWTEVRLRSRGTGRVRREWAATRGGGKKRLHSMQRAKSAAIKAPIPARWVKK
jgi:hypothetical protein